ncbi:MAG TPA: hypothetical protein PLR60_01130 [Syntrophorhabdaceae bacterium]|nr:hypothetical protein [Syntrophorhabdaceae bacterium]
MAAMKMKEADLFVNLAVHGRELLARTVSARARARWGKERWPPGMRMA